MHATIRRYEGVDMARIDEVVGKVNETFIPQLRELSGFAGYYLIKADNGIVSSLSLFETPEHAENRKGPASPGPFPVLNWAVPTGLTA